MPTLREQYYEQMKAQVTERFKNHKVRPQKNGGFLVRCEYTDEKGKNVIDSNGWMEVHCLRNGLYSGGDYDFVIFANYSGDDPIGWIGNKPMGDDYAFEKAKIGMGDLSESLYQVDDKIFTEEAVAYVRECIQEKEDGLKTCDIADRPEYRKTLKLYKRLLEVHTDDPATCWTGDWLLAYFEKIGLDIEPDTLHGFGRVRTGRFYNAHEAIRRVNAAINPG